MELNLINDNINNNNNKIKLGTPTLVGSQLKYVNKCCEITATLDEYEAGAIPALWLSVDGITILKEVLTSNKYSNTEKNTIKKYINLFKGYKTPKNRLINKPFIKVQPCVPDELSNTKVFKDFINKILDTTLLETLATHQGLLGYKYKETNDNDADLASLLGL